MDLNGEVYYHLDPLWSCEAIDFIGIDAYFPLTSAQNPEGVDLEAVMNGWKSGEGYDYSIEERNGSAEQKNISKQKNSHGYLRKIEEHQYNLPKFDKALGLSEQDDDHKKPLKPEWAWKNIEWWWKNFHIGADGRKTEWQPCSKKIWFTEYGFPSVTLATNQPNVFFDSSSTESAIPKYSDGAADISAQRLGIEATEKYWQKSEMVERKFLWTWDACPFPTWPQLCGLWGDCDSWSRGHWLQGKLGCMTLAGLIRHLCKNALPEQEIDVSSLDNIPILGIALAHNADLKHLLHTLQKVYGFYVIEKSYKLIFQNKSKFTPSSLKEYQKISEKNDKIVKKIVCIDDNLSEKGIEHKIHYESQQCLPSSINFTFLQPMTYQQSTVRSIGSLNSNSDQNPLYIALPIILTESQAQRLDDRMLCDAWTDRTFFSLPLTMDYADVEIGDCIIHQNHYLKVISKDIGANKSIIITGVPIHEQNRTLSDEPIPCTG